MGQRLVTTIRRSEDSTDVLAAFYHHWGAYTIEALRDISNIVAWLRLKLNTDENDFSKFTDKELQLALIRCAEDLGGGISGGRDSNEFKYISNLFKDEEFKTDNISRNSGLVALSKEGIGSLLYWAEGTADIYLDDATFNSGVWWGYDDYEQYKDEVEKSQLIPEDKLPKVSFSFNENLPLDDINPIIEELDDIDSRYIKDSSGCIVEISGI